MWHPPYPCLSFSVVITPVPLGTSRTKSGDPSECSPTSPRPPNDVGHRVSLTAPPTRGHRWKHPSPVQFYRGQRTEDWSIQKGNSVSKSDTKCRRETWLQPNSNHADTTPVLGNTHRILGLGRSFSKRLLCTGENGIVSHLCEFFFLFFGNNSILEYMVYSSG